jgi:hypothetical protein
VSKLKQLSDWQLYCAFCAKINGSVKGKMTSDYYVGSVNSRIIFIGSESHYGKFFLIYGQWQWQRQWQRHQ